jgi:hypothetical protein
MIWPDASMASDVKLIETGREFSAQGARLILIIIEMHYFS